MCALRAAHKISMFSKMRAIHCINAQNGHPLAQLSSQGEAGAQNKMCRNVLSTKWCKPWRVFLFQLLQSCEKRTSADFVEVRESQMLSKNLGHFEFFFTKCKPWRVVYFSCSPNIRRFCQPRFQISWKSWIPSETFISKHVELHFKIVTVHT